MTRYLFIALLLLAPAANAASLVVDADCSGEVADGKYRARTDQGMIRIEGAFSRGNKTGIFVFYNARAGKMIEMPYARDKLNGTIRAWHQPQDPARTETLALLSEVRNGYIQGRYQTWYPSGAKRSSFLIKDGDIQSAEIWDEAGSPVEIAAVADFLRNDIDSDFSYYQQLEQVLNDHQPSCLP